MYSLKRSPGEQAESLRGLPVQRVFSVGPKPSVLDDLEPLFSEFSIEARRIASGELTLDQIRHNVPDLLIVEHPMSDMSTKRFVDAIRDLVPTQVTIILLTPADQFAELADLEERGEIVLRSDCPRSELVESAKIFLRRDRRAPCAAMVRLNIGLGGSRMLRLVQLVNLSQSGMLVKTSEDLPLDCEVEFEITLRDEDEAVRGTAKAVRHAHSDRSHSVGLGLVFLDLEKGAAERLRGFLEAQSAE